MRESVLLPQWKHSWNHAQTAEQVHMLLTMRGTPGITLQPHQILRLPRKIAFQNQRKICRKQLKRQFQCATDPNTIRTRSDHELVISHPPVRRGYFSRFGDAFCIENYNISRKYCAWRKKWHSELLLLNCYWTELFLLLNWAVPELWLNCYWTELLLNWAVTELLLNWAVTELLLNWAVTDLLVNWAVTELSCYWTELLLSCYWAATELSCYCIFKSP